MCRLTLVQGAGSPGQTASLPRRSWILPRGSRISSSTTPHRTRSTRWNSFPDMRLNMNVAYAYQFLQVSPVPSLASRTLSRCYGMLHAHSETARSSRGDRRIIASPSTRPRSRRCFQTLVQTQLPVTCLADLVMTALACCESPSTPPGSPPVWARDIPLLPSSNSPIRPCRQIVRCRRLFPVPISSSVAFSMMLPASRRPRALHVGPGTEEDGAAQRRGSSRRRLSRRETRSFATWGVGVAVA